jgi:hypothetical protein
VYVWLSAHINWTAFVSLALIGIHIKNIYSYSNYYFLFGEFGRHTDDTEKYSARKWREISFKFETDVVSIPDRHRISLRKVIL